MLRTPTALVVASLLLLAPLAGCSSDDKPAAAATSSASEIDKVAFVDGLLAAMAAKKTAHITLTGAISGEGQVRYGDTTDLTFTAAFGSQRFSAILVGGTAYVQMSAGAKFVKVDKNDPAMSGLAGQLTYAGPREALDRLRPGIKKVEKDGAVTQGGVALTKYKVTIDAQVAANAFGGGGGVAGTTSVATLEFFVDAGDVVHRVSGDVGGRQITMVLSGWGKPVTIKAPSAEQLLQN